MNEFERQAQAALSDLRVKALLAREDVDLLTLAAAQRGWHPLKPGEKMTVHYDDKEYVIERRK